MFLSFEITEELQWLLKSVDHKFLLFRSEHVFMILVSFLHRFDLVSLSSSFGVSNYSLFNSFLDYSSLQVTDTKHEFEGVFKSFFGFVLQLFEFQEQNRYFLLVLEFGDVIEKVKLPLNLLFDVLLPK